MTGLPKGESSADGAEAGRWVAHMTTGQSLRDYWLLWGGSTVSNLGDGIRLVALPLLAVVTTTDPLAIGAVTTASYLPWLMFSLVGGAVADRVDRRRLIVTGQIVRGSVVGVFGLLVMSGAESLVLLYLVAFVIGVGEVIVDSAMQAAIPMVAGADLDTANSRFASAQFVAGEIVGGPLGGALFATTASLPFLVDAATFGAGSVLVGVIATPLQRTRGEDDKAEAPAQTSLLADIGEGARYLLDQPVLRGMTIAVSLSNVATSAVGALLVLLVVEILDGSELAFGLILAVGAVGGFLGSLAAAQVVRMIGRHSTLVGSFIVMGLAQLAIASASTPVTVAGGSFAVLFALALFNVSSQSIRQRLTPDRLLGRVIASMRFVGMGAVPVGGLGGGLVARLIGVRATIVTTAAISAVATIAIVRATRGRDLEGTAPP